MIDLHEYGFQNFDRDLAEGVVPARVTGMHRDLFEVVCPYGRTEANLSGSFLYHVRERSDYPTVGDFVLLNHNEHGHSQITSVLPRKSKFSRTDFSGHAVGYVKTILEQVVAANFDYVFIMSSLNHDFNVNRIARYLTQARQSGAIPVVVLTKADLCEKWDAQIDEIQDIAGDIAVIPVSSHTGMGLPELDMYLQPGKTIVFLGMSGVGKSSLLNALAGEEVMTVAEVREDDDRGRHTTTHRQLIMLPSGAMIIDTPGMRELGLWEADGAISASFAKVQEMITRCRFSDCRHQTEPGCAVLAALADGSLPQGQWNNYLSQKREVTFAEAKKRKNNRKRSPRHDHV
ncbi:MAG TPA: ribosome small subunit-dependent GTPase A [Firmicutes bacterium]|jgi:ribosome biogenesis GTPase|nr:ribosome small subunit-dependent GTPase A [Bacillota bacterium]